LENYLQNDLIVFGDEVYKGCPCSYVSPFTIENHESRNS